MSKEFKPGDRVVLAQAHWQRGTVVQVYNSGTCVVLWHDDDMEIEEDPDDLELE